MSITETAKELLKKGIALGDEELIQMANSLLAADETVAQPNRVDVDEFAVEPQERRELPTAVNKVQRGENLFVDDGTEHSDIETPTVVPTQRRKAAAKIKQECEECGKVTKVVDIHKRDYYICDPCLADRRR